MPLLQADRYRTMAAECRSLALLSEDEIEKTLLINLSLSWNRIANQTDRYAEFMEKAKGKVRPRGDQMPKLSAKPTESKCPACKGTGSNAVKQPAQEDRRIYPARCERCDGKGWITRPN
jgi:DnaJ-class molecular chaperone